MTEGSYTCVHLSDLFKIRMEGDGTVFMSPPHCTQGCITCHIQRIERRLAGNKLKIADHDYFKPSTSSMEGCVVCKTVDTRVALMTSESRGALARQLQVLAEDIRRMELRLAEDKPLFVHQDCLKPSTLLGLASER